MRLQGRGSFLLILMMLPAISPCTDDVGEQEARRYDGEGFSLDAPPDWVREQRDEGRGVLFYSPDPVRNARALPNEVFVFQPERAFDSLEDYIEDGYNFHEITVLARRHVQVPGATEALRIETEATTRPPAVTIRQTFIMALRSDDSVVDAVCRGAAEDFEPQVCDDTLDSLRVAAS